MTAAVNSPPSGHASASGNATKESCVSPLKGTVRCWARSGRSCRAMQPARNGTGPAERAYTTIAVPASYHAVFTARNVRRRDQKGASHPQWDRKPCGRHQPAVDRDHASGASHFVSRASDRGITIQPTDASSMLPVRKVPAGSLPRNPRATTAAEPSAPVKARAWPPRPVAHPQCAAR